MALNEYLAEEVALDCVEGLLSRREALRRLVLLGLSASAAAGLLAACGGDDGTAADPSASAGATNTPATTATTATTTAATPSTTKGAAPTGEDITFAGPHGELIGLLAVAEEPKGAVLVIHENRGLTPHIRTIPPRLAADGYTALAIDLLSEEGGTASLPSEGDATAALGNAPTDRMIADLRAGLDELERRARARRSQSSDFASAAA